MSALWFQSLQDADPGVADSLAPFVETVPLGAAVRPAEAEARARAWLQRQYPCPNMVILAGASQADLMEPLLEAVSTVRLLLLDRNLERLAEGLNRVDSPRLAEAIRSRRLVVDIGESEDAGIGRFLLAADYSRVPEIRLLDAQPVAEDDLQMADEMTRPARTLLKTQACDMSTRKRFGKEWQRQTLRNLPAILRHPGVKALFGQFPGVPALVVGAGPSLDQVIPYLKKHHSQFVVICVGRALIRYVKLVKAPPHLAITGDGQQIVARHFAQKPAGLPVVASCFSHPDVVQGLDRIFFMEMDAMGLPEWLGGKLGPRGEVFAGGNVSTAGMALAVALGCNPVLMAGVDFSYAENGKTHAKGRYGDATVQSLPDNQVYYDVPGNYRETVKTNRQMMHYIDFTQDLIAHHAQTTFINVNTDGARIEGAKLVRPEELATFAGPALDAGARIAEIYESQAQADDPGRFCDALRADMGALQTLRTECLDAAMLCNQMIMLMRRPQAVPNAEEKLRAALALLEPLDERLKSDPVMNLIEARLELANRLLSEKMMSPEELAMPPAVRSFWRWREYYKSVAEAGRWTSGALAGVIREIEAKPASAGAQATADVKSNPQPVEMMV